MDQDELIADATRIIVEKARPKRIILFGSRARGEAHEDSDVDLLIIVPDGKSSSELRSIIAIALMSAYASFDVMVYTESEYDRKLHEGWIIFDEIARDGRVVYAA